MVRAMEILFIGNTRIGDFILASGLLDHLIRTYPQARITLACGPSCIGLTREIPQIARVIPMRKRKFHRHWFELWRDVVGTRWDMIVDMRKSGVAYGLWSRRTFRLKRTKSAHKVAEAASVLGLTPAPAPKIWIGEKDRAVARQLVPEGAPFIVFGPGATHRHKTWPSERFAELAIRLTAPDGPLPQARIVLLGAPNERPEAEPTLRALPADRVIDLMDKADLLQAAAVIERAALYVGNDNGQMHLAAAVGAPTLGLFGATPAQLYGPWGPHCAVVATDRPYAELAPLLDEAVEKKTCLMDSLPVTKVVDAARDLLARAPREA